MRNIKFIPKNTKANTEYRKISIEDLNWILDRLQQLQIFIDECQYTYDLEVQEVYGVLCTPINELPRCGYYPYAKNSIRSFTSGVLKNFFAGSQRDLSSRTCDGLEIVFHVANQLLIDFDSIEFTKCAHLTKPKQIKSIVPNQQVSSNELFVFS